MPGNRVVIDPAWEAVSTVVNKTTFQVVDSANTPDYPTASWVINPPSLPTLYANGVPVRYWKVSVDGLDIVEMSAGEKTAVDTDPTNIANAQAAAQSTLKSDYGTFLESRYSATRRDALLAMHSLAIVSQQDGRRDYVATFLLWLDTVDTYVDGINDLIVAAVDVPGVLAVTWDFTPFAATDPNVDISTASKLKALSY